MKAKSIREVLEHEIRDLFSVETQILDALPTMIEHTSNEALREALEHHLSVTEEQRDRLEEVCATLSISANGKKCKGMAGILEEGADALDTMGDGVVKDAVIIAAAQRVEHYEIAGYGTALSYAALLDEDEVADLLEMTLTEEKLADRVLSDIAEGVVNRLAADE